MAQCNGTGSLFFIIRWEMRHHTGCAHSDQIPCLVTFYQNCVCVCVLFSLSLLYAFMCVRIQLYKVQRSMSEVFLYFSLPYFFSHWAQHSLVWLDWLISQFQGSSLYFSPTGTRHQSPPPAPEPHLSVMSSLSRMYNKNFLYIYKVRL